MVRVRSNVTLGVRADLVGGWVHSKGRLRVFQPLMNARTLVFVGGGLILGTPFDLGVIKVEDWAEIRRLVRAEGVPISEVARRLGISRNTVRAALASERPPRYERPPRGSLIDEVEPRLRVLVAEWPTMPATVIAQRIGWRRSMTTLKDWLRQIRPECAGVDPVDRVQYEPGGVAQCDLWFPEPRIPVGAGQFRMLPVLVMTWGYSRLISAVMIPSRQAGDILSGM